MQNDEPEVMQFFVYEHLPLPLQVISKPFAELARFVLEQTPSSAERSFALRQLLLAKDAAVRATMVKPTPWRDRQSGPVNV